jgi:hypothetical protein
MNKNIDYGLYSIYEDYGKIKYKHKQNLSYYKQYIFEMDYKQIYKNGDITYYYRDYVIDEIKKHIPSGMPLGKDCVITGGFLLKIIMKHLELEDFPDTDIDIFVSTSESLKKILKYFKKLGVETANIYGNIIEIQLEGYKYKFQIIAMNSKIYNIINDFDLGCNKVVYNGDDIYGTSEFNEYLETQVVNLKQPIKPNRFIKMLKYNVRYDYEHNLSFYRHIFTINKYTLPLIEIKLNDINENDLYRSIENNGDNYIKNKKNELRKYEINLDKVKKNMLNLYCENSILSLKGGIKLENIDIKYKNSENYVKLLKYIQKNSDSYFINIHELIQFKEEF